MLKGKLGALWRGEISLVNTFWIYNVVINTIYVLLFAFLGIVIDSLLSINNIKPTRIMALCTLLIACSYPIVALVGLWRSSNRYEGHVEWRVFAKLYVMYAAYKMFTGIPEILVALNKQLSLM